MNAFKTSADAYKLYVAPYSSTHTNSATTQSAEDKLFQALLNIDEDPVGTLSAVKELAAQGHVDAMYHCGLMLKRESLEIAKKYFKAAIRHSREGYPAASFELGLIYSKQPRDFSLTWDLAADYFMQAYSAGYNHFEIGKRLYEVQNNLRARDKAIEEKALWAAIDCLKRSYEADKNPEAAFMLACIHLEKWENILTIKRPEPKLAFELLLFAADENVAAAKFELGVRYLKGIGGPQANVQNSQVANRYIEGARKLGYQNDEELKELYLDGIGVKNNPQAQKVLKEIADAPFSFFNYNMSDGLKARFYLDPVESRHASTDSQ